MKDNKEEINSSELWASQRSGFPKTRNILLVNTDKVIAQMSEY